MLNVVQIQTVAIILVLSYFIGNFQTAVLFSKRFLHDDVRLHGSGVDPLFGSCDPFFGGRILYARRYGQHELAGLLGEK